MSLTVVKAACHAHIQELYALRPEKRNSGRWWVFAGWSGYFYTKLLLLFIIIIIIGRSLLAAHNLYFDSTWNPLGVTLKSGKC